MKFPQQVMQTRPGEDQVMRGMFDDRAHTPYRIDLRPLEDDKTVYRNPHKGWFWHYVDNGFRRGAYRDRTPEDDFLPDFPGLNHLYIRFDWSDVERTRGVYDFSRIDEIMERWGAHGYTFSLRACTFEGSADMNYATPRYVFEEGARCYDLGEYGIQPDYGDPIFLDRLERFMQAFGDRYNRDARVELVDIGTYGTWGEGHTVCGDNVIYPMDVVKKHMDLHTRYFPDTFLLCNDDHIIGRMAHGAEEVNEMLDYAEARGFGAQDDSICCDGYSVDCGYDTMRARWAFERLYKNAPSTIEFAHYTYIRPTYDHFFRDGFTIVDALKNAHATFAGFHGYPRDWLARETHLTAYCANRLGYWFFMPYAVIPPLQNTAHNVMTLRLENHGWSRAYHPYTLKIKVSGDGGERINVSSFDVRQLDSGEGQDVRIPLDLRGLSAGAYAVSVGLFEGERPVRPALKAAVESEGYYTIHHTRVDG